MAIALLALVINVYSVELLAMKFGLELAVRGTACD